MADTNGCLTLEVLEEAWRRTVETRERPHVEYHHPRCPKILTEGAKACRCGAAPFEAIFEDAPEKPKAAPSSPSTTEEG